LLDWGQVKLLFCDVDGVLTDGAIYFSAEGQALKRFHVHDGFGIRRLQAAGVKVVLVSGDDSPIVEARARRLGIEEYYTDVSDKGAVVRAVLEREGLQPEQACYIGDDVLDVPAMRLVGLPCAVPNAHPAALEVAVYVTSRRGGEGAVREICDLVLQARAASA
jgi:3-deoxy-D-manno-octulosonate 8-phosphate phosphatase (KDO 8-P phosphatase)